MGKIDDYQNLLNLVKGKKFHLITFWMEWDI